MCPNVPKMSCMRSQRSLLENEGGKCRVPHQGRTLLKIPL